MFQLYWQKFKVHSYVSNVETWKFVHINLEGEVKYTHFKLILYTLKMDLQQYSFIQVPTLYNFLFTQIFSNISITSYTCKTSQEKVEKLKRATCRGLVTGAQGVKPSLWCFLVTGSWGRTPTLTWSSVKADTAIFIAFLSSSSQQATLHQKGLVFSAALQQGKTMLIQADTLHRLTHSQPVDK